MCQNYFNKGLCPRCKYAMVKPQKWKSDTNPPSVDDSKWEENPQA